MQIVIEIKGHLDKHWTSWFENMNIEYRDENTLLTGKVIDQAALHGLIANIGALNLTLISVNTVSNEDEKD